MKIRFKLANDFSSIEDGKRFALMLPQIEGLVPEFCDAPNQTSVLIKGPHSKDIWFYGICTDGATLPSGAETLSDEAYATALRNTKFNVPHKEGWVFDEEAMVWVPPVPYPTDGAKYEWNDDNRVWTKSE